MSYLQGALDEAKRLAFEKEEIRIEYEQKQKLYEQLKKDLESSVNSCLNEFDGYNGISRKHTELYKDGKVIAYIRVDVINNITRISWAINYTYNIYDKADYYGEDLKEFANKMAKYVV